nr:MAG TPA: hypothetical protein [Caudoviricetes sp.]
MCFDLRLLFEILLSFCLRYFDISSCIIDYSFDILFFSIVYPTDVLFLLTLRKDRPYQSIKGLHLVLTHILSF